MPPKYWIPKPPENPENLDELAEELAANAGLRIQATKPPQGLKPRYVHDLHRLLEIHAAIGRYLETHRLLPPEWMDEYNELIKPHLG